MKINLDDQVTDASIAVLIVAFMGVLALTSLFRASTTSVPSTVVTIVTFLVGLLFAIGIVFVFYRYMVKDQI